MHVSSEPLLLVKASITLLFLPSLPSSSSLQSTRSRQVLLAENNRRGLGGHEPPRQSFRSTHGLRYVRCDSVYKKVYTGVTLLHWSDLLYPTTNCRRSPVWAKTPCRCPASSSWSTSYLSPWLNSTSTKRSPTSFSLANCHRKVKLTILGTHRRKLRNLPQAPQLLSAAPSPLPFC